MLFDRTDLYSTVTVNGNQELDMISGNFSAYVPVIQDSLLVPQSMEGRLDLISFQYYGTPNYWWLIALVNNILDIEAEVVVGAQLNIPSLPSLYNFYNANAKADQQSSVSETGFSVLT